ncbi:MAG: carboxypeptidase regulatory-like domain-containing protein [Candidatus Eremiobacteraeota bacterium]|nr:carboxypeptidase regulatory-like domain-containing protein [Candidatus Eremiobacteraeota bacterium]
MKGLLSVALAGMFALTACGGPHGASSAIPGSATTQQHVRHPQLTGGQPLDVLGGAPSRLFSLALNLFDAPLNGFGDVKVNAGILGVDAIDASGDSWQLIANAQPAVVNLLDLQDHPAKLGSGDLPAGTYPALQLLLDPATTNVTIFGRTFPVVFVDPNHPWWDPTQTVEAITVPLAIAGNPGQSITASLDFNVFQSVNFVNGVIEVTPTVAAGIGDPAITGKVVNAAGKPVANATIVATGADGAVANTSVSGSDGSFHLHALNPGGYTISVANTFKTNAGATVTASGADPGTPPTRYVVIGPNSQIDLGKLND